jgi:hypothetical protein
MATGTGLTGAAQLRKDARCAPSPPETLCALGAVVFTLSTTTTASAVTPAEVIAVAPSDSPATIIANATQPGLTGPRHTPRLVRSGRDGRLSSTCGKARDRFRPSARVNPAAERGGRGVRATSVRWPAAVA